MCFLTEINDDGNELNEKKLWQNDINCTIIKNCDKNILFRFRLAIERINYLLLDVKWALPKKFDINPFL